MFIRCGAPLFFASGAGAGIGPLGYPRISLGGAFGLSNPDGFDAAPSGAPFPFIDNSLLFAAGLFQPGDQPVYGALKNIAGGQLVD